MAKKHKKAAPVRPDRGAWLVIDEMQELEYFLINGEELRRIKHNGKYICEDCGVEPQEYHCIPCKKEHSPCKAKCLTAWDCNCPSHSTEMEKQYDLCEASYSEKNNVAV